MLHLLLACAQAPEVAPPGVLVAVVDSLRADHLNLEGYPAGARVYTRAYSAAPWTSSSAYTLTTGLLPSTDLRAAMAPWDFVLSTTRGWIAATGEGWPTAVVTDHSVVAHAWDVPEQPYRLAEEGVNLDQGGRVYLHVTGAHTPYTGRTGQAMAGADQRYQDLGEALAVRHEAVVLPPDLAGWAPVAYEVAADHALARLRPLVSDAVGRGWAVVARRRPARPADPRAPCRVGAGCRARPGRPARAGDVRCGDGARRGLRPADGQGRGQGGDGDGDRRRVDDPAAGHRYDNRGGLTWTRP